MQYMLLIYEDERVYGNKDGPVTMEIVGRHMALAQSLGATLVNGSGLRNTDAATTVRTGTDGKQVLHDGPFAETKEQLGGYYLIEAPDLDAALAIARKLPLHGAGAIEVRPLLNGERKG